MSLATFRLGLRQCTGRPGTIFARSSSQLTPAAFSAFRQISSVSRTQQHHPARCSNHPHTSTIHSQTCQASTTTTANHPADSSVRANPNQPPTNTLLSWNAFFSLRTSRRRYSLASSVFSSLVTTGSTFILLSTQPDLADEITKLVPLDPIMSMGILTFASTFLGWLIGPIFGNAVWKLVHRGKVPEFTVKEREFFSRIKKRRSDPTGASTINMVPDYYGEKVGSVRGYRRWLKDQKAFERKKVGLYPKL